MEIRTPVLTLKGLRPGPLDDGGLMLSIWRRETAHIKAGGLYHPLARGSSN
jgi:hypothetical protein